MAGNSKRSIIQIESTAGTGFRYTITKSKRLHPERVEFKKYDPIVIHRNERTQPAILKLVSLDLIFICFLLRHTSFTNNTCP